ncbi:MAG: response regulator transcription factor [Melioribacteraceae bacterium]|nr:response regulator transcription factor [Melioribacteraceae bacterium]MCO6472197.1 response regulator transcription factor [Melioribacteraceae bacterium]MDD3557439.1 response regulator transcription factor [Melioribacteraceae bacterium]
MVHKVLLVDDEEDILEFMQYNLEQEGFEVVTANNGEDALSKLTSDISLVILDVMMPKMNGYEVCSNIRAQKKYQDLPVIFLTAKSSEKDEVHGLNIGADDFIKKPISPQKLIARVKSNLRKLELTLSEVSIKEKIEIGPLHIDRSIFTILIDGKEIIFPKKEFEILSYLASQPGKVFPREKLLSDIWGTDIFVVERTVDVHIRKIREKLGKHSDLIETIKGVGYRFKNIE